MSWGNVQLIPRVTQPELAAQVASLVNRFNQLYYRINADRVLHGPVHYLIELEGEKVIACAGIKKLRRLGWYEVCHICVHPDYRRKKLGIKMFEAAYRAIPTGKGYCTIRGDNIPSVKAALRVGFKIQGKYWSRDHWVLILTREKDDRAGETQVFNLDAVATGWRGSSK